MTYVQSISEYRIIGQTHRNGGSDLTESVALPAGMMALKHRTGGSNKGGIITVIIAIDFGSHFLVNIALSYAIGRISVLFYVADIDY